ncbi:hypothetical protein TNCV_4701531 [Trichonephila clavipes]|nr:hypothetical protein TNCV_4701531 [Trichonephila clavipes]
MEGKSCVWTEDDVVTAVGMFVLRLDDSGATDSVSISRSLDRNLLTDLGSPPIPIRAFCITKGDMDDIELLGSEIMRNLVLRESWSTLRLGSMRPSPGLGFKEATG